MEAVVLKGESVAAAFSAYAREKLRVELSQIARCAGLLSADELWRRHNAHTNSVANLILHLTGNVRQWIIGGVGGEAIARDRPAEFADRSGRPAAEIVPPLEQAVARACEVIGGLRDDELLRPLTIQGYAVTPLVAVFHVTEHFSFHTGQIVHITKAWRDVDLSLYDAQGRKNGNLPASP